MSEFVAYLEEVFEGFGKIRARRMFGGYGIYHDDVMFGLVANDTLYLKADETTAHLFEKRGLGPFEYGKGGRIVKMSCYLAPEEIFDSQDEATLWAKRAYEAALRAKARGKRKEKA